MLARSTILFAAALCSVATVSCKKSDATASGAGDGGAEAAASASLAFLGTFEGEIDGFFKDSSKPGAQQVPLDLEVKAGKVRLAVPEGLAKGAMPMMGGAGEKAYVIYDSGAKKMTIVTDTKKEAIVLDINNAGKTMPTPPPGAPGHPGSASPSKVTKTGKTDTVAGYTCEYWDITSDHKEGSVCVASDGPSWLQLAESALPSSQSWAAELVDGKHFPLRFIGYAKDGTTEESRVEVTKIDKKTLADTEFQVPAGYKTIDLEKMMQGMGGMPGMPQGIPGMPPMPPHPPVKH
jgi:hypothetical protein